MTTRVAGILVLTAAAAMIAQTAAAATIDEQIKEVMGRIQKRTPELAKLKDAGTVGETCRGLIETVKPSEDKAVNKLVADENADREKLFRLLASKTGTTAEKVRLNFAAFRFKKAAKGHFYKGRNGQWLTKAEWIRKGPNAPFTP